MREIKKIIVHCSASEFGNKERIKKWHTVGEGNTKGRGWSDIGYHYVINNGKIHKGDKVGEHIEDGFIEKGRAGYVAGAHCRGQNKDSIGICLIGNYDFTDNQYKSLVQLLNGLMEQYNLTINDVYGHYEFDTHGKTCPNFNPRDKYLEYKEK